MKHEGLHVRLETLSCDKCMALTHGPQSARRTEQPEALASLALASLCFEAWRQGYVAVTEEDLRLLCFRMLAENARTAVSVIIAMQGEASR